MRFKVPGLLMALSWLLGQLVKLFIMACGLMMDGKAFHFVQKICLLILF